MKKNISFSTSAYNRRKRDQGDGHDHSNLSMCAADYAASLGDPFGGPENACIPDFPALMTGKNRVWARGTFSTSTAGAAGGFGYIDMTPEFGAANDNFNFVNTNGLTDVSTSIYGTPGSALNYASNSPYVAAAYGVAGLQYRVVSAGLRIKYVGAEFYRGGTIYGLMSPSHGSLAGSTGANLLLYKEGKQMSVPDGKWTTLLYRPVEKADYDFKTALSPIGVGTQTQYMAFAIQAYDTSGANPATFEWEAYVNHEIQGAIVVNKTPSHVDVVGMGAVNAATVLSPALHSPTQNPVETISSALVSLTSHYLGSATSKPVPPGSQSSRGSPASSGEQSIWSEILGVAKDVLPVIGEMAMALI